MKIILELKVTAEMSLAEESAQNVYTDDERIIETHNIQSALSEYFDRENARLKNNIFYIENINGDTFVSGKPKELVVKVIEPFKKGDTDCIRFSIQNTQEFDYVLDE